MKPNIEKFIEELIDEYISVKSPSDRALIMDELAYLFTEKKDILNYQMSGKMSSYEIESILDGGFIYEAFNSALLRVYSNRVWDSYREKYYNDYQIDFIYYQENEIHLDTFSILSNESYYRERVLDNDFLCALELEDKSFKEIVERLVPLCADREIFKDNNDVKSDIDNCYSIDNNQEIVRKGNCYMEDLISFTSFGDFSSIKVFEDSKKLFKKRKSPSYLGGRDEK